MNKWLAILISIIVPKALSAATVNPFHSMDAKEWLYDFVKKQKSVMLFLPERNEAVVESAPDILTHFKIVTDVVYARINGTPEWHITYVSPLREPPAEIPHELKNHCTIYLVEQQSRCPALFRITVSPDLQNIVLVEEHCYLTRSTREGLEFRGFEGAARPHFTPLSKTLTPQTLNRRLELLERTLLGKTLRTLAEKTYFTEPIAEAVPQPPAPLPQKNFSPVFKVTLLAALILGIEAKEWGKKELAQALKKTSLKKWIASHRKKILPLFLDNPAKTGALLGLASGVALSHYGKIDIGISALTAWALYRFIAECLRVES